MRIAFVSYDFGEYSVRHAGALLEFGEVMLILPRRLADPYLGLLEPKVDFRPFDKPRLRQPLRQISQVRQILNHIEAFQPDVVHLQAGHGWFNMALGRLRRFPLVITAHDPMHHLGDWESRKTPQWIVHHGYRKADRVIVHGRTLREIAADAIGVSRDVIDVVPMIAVGDRPEMTAMSEEENLILFFGRIWAYKGLEYLIRALPRISESVPDARILIAGTGDDFSPYRALMHDPSRFIIHNRWIPDEERAELFQSAAVVVLPYIDATQSGVIPIAYAFSKPVVATTTGGLPDLVDHGTTGLLVPPREVEALADAIVQILTDDALRRRMGEAGNRKLKAECAPNIVAAATADVYRRAIEAHESSVGGG